MNSNAKSRKSQSPRPSVAEIWREKASELAAWAMKRLVNRNDAWGQYLPVEQRTPQKKLVTKKDDLTVGVLERHFRGKARGHLITLHAISQKNTSNWVAIDVDQHGDDSTSLAKVNECAAIKLYKQLKALGVKSLLLDSNGNGGFHLLVLFATPVKAEQAFHFGRWLIRDWEDLGLKQSPEAFPKQRKLSKKKPFGSSVRLPGRHHTRDHWTRVWDGEKWLTGADAVNAILGAKPVVPTKIPREALLELESPVDAAAVPNNGFDPNSQRPLHRVLARLKKVTESGDGYRACCPAHKDNNPSLSVTEIEGNVLVYCFNGCTFDEIVETLDLSARDFFANCAKDQDESHSAARPDRGEVDAEHLERMSRLNERFQEELDGKLLKRLGKNLGVPVDALKALGVGCCTKLDCWTFPEWNARRQIVGITCRLQDGRKLCIKGSKRGLILPDGWDQRKKGPILVPEGASDVAALHAMGLTAVGRPAANQGAELLSQLLRGNPQDVIILGEFDAKPDGSWPGLAGAKRVAAQLSDLLGREVKWALPPEQAKDARAWLAGQEADDAQ